MATNTKVKVAGAWRTVTQQRVKVAGAWRVVADDSRYVKVNGIWREPSSSVPPPSGGTYVLGPSSISLGSGSTAWALFNTVPYRGSIVELKIRLGWNYDNFGTYTVLGRTSGNSYRTIGPHAFGGQTIDHNISSVDPASLTEFNSGAATGYTITGPAFMSTYINSIQLWLRTT